ncbi:MAG: hypothetical protein K2X77_06955 [Candidatus Obscuribacterales bacterium]|jgi:hypothetical protein|nr:hypothetical protein [Candidatus Obscuribacterales bacterium]
MPYLAYNTAFNRNLFRVLMIRFQENCEQFLMVELSTEDLERVRAWGVEVTAPVLAR